MYQGIRNSTIAELAQKLEDEKLLKRDLVIPSNCLGMKNAQLTIDNLPNEMFRQKMVDNLLEDFGIQSTGQFDLRFNPTDLARRQIAGKLNIPVRYYRYLQEDHCDLLDTNVSELLNRAGKNYFVRTFAPTEGSGETGLFRSFLSDRYQVVDNLDVLYSALQAIKEAGANVEIANCNLSEKRMYVEFVRPEARVQAEDYFNDYHSPDGNNDGGIYSGFVISNSEVGAGSYKIVPRAIVGACKNGLMFKRDAMRKTHLGSQMDEGIQWSQRTQQKGLELIKSQITDAVGHFMSTDFLKEKLSDLSQYNERLQHPTQAVENVCSELSITKEEQADVLNYFIDGGDFSPVGAMQAVTYHAHEQENADKQYELESEALDMLPSFYDRFDHNENN